MTTVRIRLYVTEGTEDSLQSTHFRKPGKQKIRADHDCFVDKVKSIIMTGPVKGMRSKRLGHGKDIR